MRIEPLALEGVRRIVLDRREDSRGFFARSFCQAEFAKHGLFTDVAQINTSGTLRKGSLRGLHFQREPVSEAKVVRVVRGAIFDVAVDLRRGSDTYGQWTSLELSSENKDMIYIPEGFAHGFQTLSDNVEMIYLHSVSYVAELNQGVRYDDPEIGVAWPLPIEEISERDRALPALAELEPLAP